MLNVVSLNLVSICVTAKATASYSVQNNTQIVVIGYQMGWTRTSTKTLMSFGWAPHGTSTWEGGGIRSFSHHISVAFSAYLLLELEWRQLLTRPVSRSCQARFQGGVFLLVHVRRHLQCTCTTLLYHILSVAAVWTGVCGVGWFCVI